MTMRGRIIDGVLVITDVYEPAEVSAPPRRSARLLFSILAVMAVGVGAYVGLHV